jgi:hypothetical protein
MAVTRAKQTRRRGVALVGGMLVLLMILTILLLGALANGGTNDEAGGVAGHSDNVMWSGRRRAYALAAQSLSESGVRLLLEWLNNGSAINSVLQAGPPSLAGSPFYGATQVGNYDEITTSFGGSTGKIRVRLYPYSKNATNNRRLFVAESIGEYMGISQVIRTVITEKTFARYAMFCDTCPVNWWVQENTFFNGPVHINGSNSTGTGVDSAAAMNILWKAASTQKIFAFNGSDSFTTSMSSSQLKWNKETAGTLSTPSGGQWANIIGTGAAPQASKPRVKMPSQSGKQYTAALAGTGEPATIGVKIPASGGQTTGGIFIKGDVTNMNLTASGPNNTVQTITIRQLDGATEVRTTVTINPNTNTTTIQRDTRPSAGGAWAIGSATSVNGTTNGVIYGSGDIDGLNGTIANNVMSGVDVVKTNDLSIVTDATKSMKINGGLVYANLVSDATDPTNPKSNASAATNTSGTLGLVSRRVTVREFGEGGSTPLTDMSLHATVFAYDTFDAANPRNTTDPVTGIVTPGRATGNFKLLGGYIAKNNGTFGQVDANSNLLAGFRMNRNYDQRAADNPPPFFPSEENSFQVTSFQRVGTPIQ